MHDSLGADLAGLALTVESAAKVLQQDNPLQIQTLNEVALNLKIKAQEIKAIARGDTNTRPAALAQYGLEGAITRYVNTRLPDLEKSVRCSNLTKNLNATLEDQLYLITLEAVNNVAQHAHATACSVYIESLPDKPVIVLQIIDNGLGIPPHPKLSTGLRSMQQRAVEIGGEFSIENNRPSGTRLKVVINLARSINQ